MTLYTKRSFRLATSPLLFSLIAMAVRVRGRLERIHWLDGSPTDTTVIGWFVGATGVETTVKAGSTVQWKSIDNMAHTVTSGSMPSAFAELNVPAGGMSSPMTFNTPGTFPYFCSIHGAKVQNGTLTVTP